MIYLCLFDYRMSLSNIQNIIYSISIFNNAEYDLGSYNFVIIISNFLIYPNGNYQRETNYKSIKFEFK